MNASQAPQQWSKQRLRAVVVTVAVLGAALIVILAYSLVRSVLGRDAGFDTETKEPKAAQKAAMFSDVALGRPHRDKVATAPMPTARPADMYPAEPAATTLPGLETPTADVVGPAAVLTGFPHTPEGAVGQLAQLDVAVLQAMSPQVAREVYDAWSLPGGVDADEWQLTMSVRSFLTRSGMGEGLAPTAAVDVQPAAALIKGTDGPDWVTVCVLSKIHATYESEADVAFGHCERMRWAGGRWMIAAGDPPAPAPSTWPGTEAAVNAGWRPLAAEWGQ